MLLKQILVFIRGAGNNFEICQYILGITCPKILFFSTKIGSS